MADRSSEKTGVNCSAARVEGEPGPLPAGEERIARLIRTIEGEIVPRLLVSLSGAQTAAAGGPDPDAVDEIARLSLVSEDSGAAELVRLIHRPGLPPELNCLRLIPHAARRLGELWERDECDFDQLLAGLSRLESVIRRVNGRAGSA